MHACRLIWIRGNTFKLKHCFLLLDLLNTYYSYFSVLSFCRRIWRKVNSKRGIPGHHAAGRGESDDEEEEEESKWNWYIS